MVTIGGEKLWNLAAHQLQLVVCEGLRQQTGRPNLILRATDSCRAAELEKEASNWAPRHSAGWLAGWC